MKFFKISFTICLKMILKNISIIIFLALLPLIIFVVSKFTLQNHKEKIVVGVCVNKDSKIAVNIVNSLNDKGNEIIFKTVQTTKAVETGVATGEFITGYIFDENFDQDIKSREYRKLIKVITTKQNPYYLFINQQVFAQLFEVVGTINTYDFYKQTVNENDIDIEKYFEKVDITKQNTKFEITPKIIDATSQNKNLDQTDTQIMFFKILSRGIIACYLLATAFSSIIYVNNFSGNYSVQLLGVFTSKKIFKAAYILAHFCVSTFVAVLASVFLDILAFENINTMLINFAVTLLYQILLLFFSLLLSATVRAEKLVVFLPFIIIASFIFSQAVIDISLIFPKLQKVMAFLPCYQYVKATIDNTHILYMAFLSVCFACLYAVYLFKPKKMLYNNKKGLE